MSIIAWEAEGEELDSNMGFLAAPPAKEEPLGLPRGHGPQGASLGLVATQTGLVGPLLSASLECGWSPSFWLPSASTQSSQVN